MFLTTGMLPGAADFVYQEMKKMVVSFYRRYDVILEYDLQFFAAEGMAERRQSLLPRKNYLMPEKKVRLPKAVKLPMDLDF